jgi:outer membrane lipoprotein carrier protein
MLEPQTESPRLNSRRYPPHGLFSATALLALLVCAGFAAPVRAQNSGGCERELMERVQRAYQAITSFSGKFAQTDRSVDKEERKAQGRIAYQKAGKMRWDYDPPNEQLVVTDGRTVWLFDPLLENVTVQKLERVTQGTPLAFLLGVGNLVGDFDCRAFTRQPPKDGLTYLELVPRKEIPTLSFIQIGVTRSGSELQSLRILDKQGNEREIRFSGLRQSVSFEPGFFSFTITDGMEVIRE